ncbi:MAG: response regulator [Syntrophales bacterium]|nr:response regulator [Syntrophales bacterium]
MKEMLGNRRVRILVVDPEDWCRDFLSSVMRLCGFQEYTLVSSVAEALQALEETAFDLLITDFKLTQQQRFLESVRHRDPSMRFIFMLQQRSHTTRLTYLEHADYVFKPLVLDEIVRKIRDAIHQKNLHRAEEEIRRLKQTAFRILG